jgi:hypothetical protein
VGAGLHRFGMPYAPTSSWKRGRCLRVEGWVPAVAVLEAGNGGVTKSGYGKKRENCADEGEDAVACGAVSASGPWWL